MSATSFAMAQTTTVRHGKHVINDVTDDQPNDITRAEDAIQKKDFAAAEPLLKKAIAADPKNYQAWFDLGFVYNRLGRQPDSIHAYRQSVAAKPDVFESNLNLGLMLARSNNPEAEPFLRAAAKLNLALHVRGKLPDGRHRIETIFAFCNDGDRLTADPADTLSLTTSGLFAPDLGPSEDNMVLRAAQALQSAAGIAEGAALHLNKQLPVASGIGGGSADAIGKQIKDWMDSSRYVVAV